MNPPIKVPTMVIPATTASAGCLEVVVRRAMARLSMITAAVTPLTPPAATWTTRTCRDVRLLTVLTLRLKHTA
jgi:hypothetical protein